MPTNQFLPLTSNWKTISMITSGQMEPKTFL